MCASATAFDPENIEMPNHTKATPDRASHANGTSTLTAASPQTTEAQGSPQDWIRVRAYELYIQRGAQPNDDLRDWLQAEQELRQAMGAAVPDGKGEQQTAPGT